MKSLVIAEKPSVARDIARVLHCSQKGNGSLEGKEYVAVSYTHLWKGLKRGGRSWREDSCL